MFKKLLVLIAAGALIGIISSISNGVLVPIVLGIIIGIVVYFIPSYVAHQNNHIQKTPILILNIFLGWTFIGWLIALIWATMKNKNS